MGDQDRWRARVEGLVGQIRQMDARTQKVEVPYTGSSLAADDSLLPNHPVSPLVWYGFSVGSDCLRQIDDVLTAVGGLPMRPFALYNLTRSALLAMSQSLWLLSGSTRLSRVRRALQIYSEEWSQHRAFLNDFKRSSSALATMDNESLVLIDESIAELDAKLAWVQTFRLDRFNSTSIVEDATKWLFRSQPESWGHRSVKYQWRFGSAVAHARMWPVNIRDGILGGSDDGATVDYSTQATWEELGTAMSAAMAVANEAFLLWDLRRATILQSSAPLRPLIPGLPGCAR